MSVAQGLVELHRVVLVGFDEKRADPIRAAINDLRGTPAPDSLECPLVVLRQATRREARDAKDLLKAAGGKVSVESYQSPPPPKRSARCPSCGSGSVQPFPYAGGRGASVKNVRCRSCGHLFHA